MISFIINFILKLNLKIKITEIKKYEIYVKY